MPARALRSAVALVVLTAAGAAGVSVPAAGAAGTAAARKPSAQYSVLGQPSLSATSLASRCAGADARFGHNGQNGGVDGPTGIAVASTGRLFVVDDGGRRVLSWPDADALTRCQPADEVIGAGKLTGPEAIAVDGSGRLYVADTLDQTIKIFAPGHGKYTLVHTIGRSGNPRPKGPLYFPRGVAVDENGTLFVADDYHDRVLIYHHPLTEKSPDDSISAGDDGGLSGPKALAVSGDTLFVADYGNKRVLSFTGPFTTPNQVYRSTATFTGAGRPVDLALGPDGTLYVSGQGSNGNATTVSTYANAVLRTKDVTKPTGAISAHVDSALGLAVDIHGRLFVSEYSDYRVLVRKTPVDTAPVDPHATKSTRALLAQFYAAPSHKTNRVAIGQELRAYASAKNTGYLHDFHRLHKEHLPTPSIMSAEVSDLYPSQNPKVVTSMLAHARAGGIVALDWHPDNPVNDAANSYTTPVTTAQLHSLTQSNTKAYARWHQQLAAVAGVLHRFAAAGVPVIFRPLVESNLAKYFWWGNNGSRGPAHAAREAAFAAVWHDLVHYLTVAKKLHNLLFDYSVNSLSGSLPGLDYYPGSSDVDLVGVDVYSEKLYLDDSAPGLGEYAELVHTGKPFGLSEFGQANGNNGTGPGGHAWDARTLTDRVRDSYPRATYAIAWYSTPGKHPYVFGLSDVAHTAGMLHDPVIRTL